MAAGDVSYGTATSISATNLAGLASNGYWASGDIDNSSNKFLGAFVGGRVTLNSSITADGFIHLYAFGSYDGTTFTCGLENVTGRPATITWGTNTGANGYMDLRYLGSAATDDTDDGDIVEFGPFEVSSAFGRVLPIKWGIVLLNSSGAALASSGTFDIYYTGWKIATS